MVLTWNTFPLPGGCGDQKEAYFQEVHLQRCGPGPASGHVLVSLNSNSLSKAYSILLVPSDKLLFQYVVHQTVRFRNLNLGMLDNGTRALR